VSGVAAGLNRIAKVLDVLGMRRGTTVMRFTSVARRVTSLSSSAVSRPIVVMSGHSGTTELRRMSREQSPLLPTPEVAWLPCSMKYPCSDGWRQYGPRPDATASRSVGGHRHTAFQQCRNFVPTRADLKARRSPSRCVDRGDAYVPAARFAALPFRSGAISGRCAALRPPDCGGDYSQ
jgi:hypothetical protein